MIFGFAGGAAGGGGGGARTADELDCCRVWEGMLTEAAAAAAAAAGWGCGTGLEEAAAGLAAAEAPPDGRGWAVRLAGNREGLPPGPPGLMSLPRVMGLGGTGLPLGVGLETELGGSPCWVCTVPLL